MRPGGLLTVRPLQVQQQMQTQLTDLREKLTSAFGEITNLVKQKTANDQATGADMSEAGVFPYF